MSAILTDSHPCRHIVYPYSDEERAVTAVYLFASSGLSKGESVVLIMSDAHCEPITGRLSNGGFDLKALQATGQLECISAESMLLQFASTGKPDETMFNEMIGRVIARAKANSPCHRVRVFGEMVSLLLIRKDVAAAERLEKLWNEVIESHNISLLCTYTMLEGGYATLPETIAKLHTHNIASWFPDVQAGATGD